MNNEANIPPQLFTKTITIHTPASKLWAALTDPQLIKQWMSENELNIITGWQPGSPFIMRGDLHGMAFENNGTVLQFEPEKILSYSHLSSLSQLEDKEENYSIIEFVLTPAGEQTSLTVTLTNFPTEAIYRHLAFYWNVAPELLKKFVEGGLQSGY